MSFASPDRWMWLLIALPIVALYILRTRLRRQRVATLLFWDQVFDQKRQRSWWQRLRHWVSLLLQLAFLLLVVAALVDPLWEGEGNQARQVVIVVDNSASMAAATASGPTRFDQARDQALAVLAAVRDGDEVALVTAGSSVRVPVGMTDFTPAVRDAIRALEPTDGPSRALEAVAAARRLTRAPEHRSIVLISDACFDGAEQLQTIDDVDWIAVGEATDNLAVTQLALRRSLVDPIGYAALIEVENFGETAVSSRLTIELAGDLVDVIPLNIDPGQSWRKTITGASAEGGLLRVSLNHRDGLSIDNEAIAVLPKRPRIPVLLVTAEPSLYLESVLGAIPLVDLTVTTTAPPQAPRGGFMMLHRIVPESLPSGAVFAIDPQGDSDAWKRGRPLEQAMIAEQASGSPLLPHVRLTNVALPGASELLMGDDAESLLVEAGGATLMASRVGGDDRLIVLAADLEGSDLPLRIAFPVLMTNAVNWFLGRTGELQPALRTGRLAEIPIGGSTYPAWQWLDPTGRAAAASVADEKAVIGPVDHVGIVELRPLRSQDAPQPNPPAKSQTPSNSPSTGPSPEPSSESITLAVNLCDRGESDLKPRLEPRPQPISIAGSGRRSLWFYLACAALGLITAEWFLYQRRVVG